jgi:hypothetical protein
MGIVHSLVIFLQHVQKQLARVFLDVRHCLLTLGSPTVTLDTFLPKQQDQEDFFPEIRQKEKKGKSTQLLTQVM